MSRLLFSLAVATLLWIPVAIVMWFCPPHGMPLSLANFAAVGAISWVCGAVMTTCTIN